MAIASGDPGEEYYHLKITRNGPENLEKRFKDGWGMCFPAGAVVLRCHFFVRQEEEACNFHSYRLEKGKVAVVYDATACYICQELQCQLRNNREVVGISEQLHLHILHSLNGLSLFRSSVLYSSRWAIQELMGNHFSLRKS